MTFKKINSHPQTELLEGLSLRRHEHEPDTVLFSADDAEKLICKAQCKGLEIIYMECWTSNRMEYFTTHCKDLYTAKHKVPATDWAKHAFSEIMAEYKKEVLEKFPDDEPLFSVEFAS